MIDAESQRMDDEANAFALELLMPEAWIRRDASGIDLFDEVGIAKLAKRYKVSPALMAFRIGQIHAVTQP